MHEILNSFKQKPTQNFNNHSLILKKPKIFQKPQKLRVQTMEIHENERIEAYQVKKNLINLEECLKITWERGLE